METAHVIGSQCTHHWLLGQPQDGLVPGRCRNCGAERSFPAYLDEYERPDPGQDNAKEIAGSAVGGARPTELSPATKLLNEWKS